MTIFIWPDGSWLYAEEYNEVSDAWRGDDYQTVYVSDNMEDYEIDAMVLGREM